MPKIENVKKENIMNYENEDWYADFVAAEKQRNQSRHQSKVKKDKNYRRKYEEDYDE